MSFQWPWQYDFPPFFTLQPNLSTREKQLEAWVSLVLDYLQHKRVTTVDITELQQSELFSNERINRRLSAEGIKVVLAELERRKHLEWADKSRRTRAHIYWRRPAEWASLLHSWARGNGMLNAVCTLYELTQGEDTQTEAFYGLEKEILLKALNILQSEGRAELINVGQNEGASSEQQLSPNSMLHDSSFIEEGHNVIVYVGYGQTYPIVVKRGMTLSMRKGALRHEFLIGKRYGEAISATAGKIRPLRLTPETWTRSLPHRTQIIYTPDAATIIAMLDLKPGCCVLEAGTGSGSMTHNLARTIAPAGHVHTFDLDENRTVSVQKELRKHGLSNLVTSRHRNVIEQGFFDLGEEPKCGVDAVFLDLPEPWLLIEAAAKLLSLDGGYMNGHPARVGTFSPCIEQVSRACAKLHQCGFTSVETIELVPKTLKVTEMEMRNVLEQGDRRPSAETSTNKKRKIESGQDEMSQNKVMSFCAQPAVQPTHTSYLTFATFISKK